MPRIRNHTNPLCFSEKWDPINLELLFEKKQELNIELGFGRGKFIKRWAKKNPNTNILGIEVRKQMVKELREKHKHKTKNLKAIHGNGIKIIQN